AGLRFDWSSIPRFFGDVGDFLAEKFTDVKEYFTGKEEKEEPSTGPRKYIVSREGHGHFKTIDAALDAARDGDDILIEPGEYQESLVLKKRVTLRGHGAADRVVIKNLDATCLVMQAQSATVQKLTFQV